MIRIIALLILVIPGVIAAYGVKFMRDMVFGILHAPIPYSMVTIYNWTVDGHPRNWIYCRFHLSPRSKKK